MESIHDRMPVILDESDEERWLQEDDVDELQAMLDPYPSGLLDAYEIDTTVNDPSNDLPAVIEPLGHDQSGLGQFFVPNTDEDDFGKQIAVNSFISNPREYGG